MWKVDSFNAPASFQRLMEQVLTTDWEDEIYSTERQGGSEANTWGLKGKSAASIVFKINENAKGMFHSFE